MCVYVLPVIKYMWPTKWLLCFYYWQNVPDDIKQDLLHCSERCQAWCEAFTDGCFDDPLWFEKLIPICKIVISCIENYDEQRPKSDRAERYQRFVWPPAVFKHIAWYRYGYSLSYPLTPAPLSLAHVDCNINKTNRPNYFKRLKARLKTLIPTIG